MLLLAISRIAGLRAFLYPPHQDITVISFRAGISLLSVFLKHCGILHGFCDHIYLLPLPKKSAFHINSGHQYFGTSLFSQPIPWVRPHLFSFAVRTPPTISVFLCTTSLGIFLSWLLQVLELSVVSSYFILINIWIWNSKLSALLSSWVLSLRMAAVDLCSTCINWKLVKRFRISGLTPELWIRSCILTFMHIKIGETLL